MATFNSLQPNYRRSTVGDDYYRDAGLNPETGRPVVGPSGLSMAFGRTTNRMLEGLIPHAGVETLYQPQAQNDFLALHNGSGSVYDDPNRGGSRYITGKYWADSVHPTRSGAHGEQFVSPTDIYMQRAAEATAKSEEAKRTAYQEEVNRIRRAQSTVGKLSPELQDVFAQMTPAEKKLVVDSSPEKQYATLSSSPLRKSNVRKAGMGVMTQGDQTGINDYLKGGYGLNGTFFGYRPTAAPREDDSPVPTYTPNPAPNTKTTLPQQAPEPKWYQRQFLPSPILTPRLGLF